MKVSWPLAISYSVSYCTLVIMNFFLIYRNRRLREEIKKLREENLFDFDKQGKN